MVANAFGFLFSERVALMILFFDDGRHLLLLLLLLLPVLAAFARLDGSRGEVGFALGFVVVEGNDDVGEQDDVGDDGGGGAGVG